MDPGSPSYIERAADAQLLQALVAGDYVFLLDSRQKGKSSLVARTIVKLKEVGIDPVKLDLQRIGANLTTDQWYAGLVSGLGKELGLTKELFEFWASHQHLGPLARWMAALDTVVLAHRDRPLVIFIDEVDFVRALAFSTDEFFAGIRDCFNRRSEGNGFAQLSFCLVGVATPGQLIRNPEITPFNIGTQIELSDFTLEETQTYATVLSKCAKNGVGLTKRIHYWVNGHPYLTQLLCSRVASSPDITSPRHIDRLVGELFFTSEARLREPNLADVERRMLDPDVPGESADERRAQVLDLYGRMLKGRSIQASDENPLVASLRLSGIGLQLRGALRLRNRIYARVFNEGWRRRSLPNAELRRLAGAVRLATLRTAAVAGVVILGLSTAAVAMWRISDERQRALTALGNRTDELNRVSNERQEALTTLERTASERTKALSDLGARNTDLKRVSEERQRSLLDLQKRTTELQRVSGERESALRKLFSQNQVVTRVSSERQTALTNLQSSTEALRRKGYVGDVASLQLALTKGQLRRASDLLARTSGSPYRGWEWDYAATLFGRAKHRSKIPRGSVLELGPDGEVLGAALNELYDLKPSGAVLKRSYSVRAPEEDHIWPSYRRGNMRVVMLRGTISGHVIRDAETDRVLVPAEQNAAIMDVDPKRGVYLLANDLTLETVQVRRISDQSLIAAYTGPAYTHAARILPDGTCVSIHYGGDSSRGSAEIRHWDAKGKTIDASQTNQQYASGIAVTEDGTLYCAWGANEKLEIREVGSNKVVSILPDHPDIVEAVDFSPDGKHLLTGCRDSSVRLYDIQSARLVEGLVGHQQSVYSVIFNRKDQSPMSIDIDGQVIIWEPAKGPIMQVFKDHGVQKPGIPDERLRGIYVTGDGKRLITTSTKGVIVSRSLQTGEVVKRAPKGPSDTPLVLVSDRLRDVIATYPDGHVERLDSMTLRTVQSAQVVRGRIDKMAMAGSGRFLFFGSELDESVVCDAQTLRVLRRLDFTPSSRNPPRRIVSSARESVMIASSPIPSKEVGLYSYTTGKLIKKWNFQKNVYGLFLSLHGTRLAVTLAENSRDSDQRTIIIETQTFKELTTIPVWVGTNAPRLSPDGKILTCKDPVRRNTTIWNTDTGQVIATLDPGVDITTMGFSPDGQRFVTSGARQTFTIWDSATGTELLTVTYPSLPETPKYGPFGTESARFSPDGRDIVMACADLATRVWRTAPDRDQANVARKW